MTVTFKDELGIVWVKIDTSYGVSFGQKALYTVVYFTDENGKDYQVNAEHLISISAE